MPLRSAFIGRLASGSEVSRRLAAPVLYVAGLLMMLRREWPLPARRSMGDNEDGAVLIATLEHWFHVFTGQSAAWLSPGWFWPATNTVSYTDTYFLMALPYAAARGLGLDPFDSYDVVAVVLATAGFWSFAALARSLGSGTLVGAAFAFVFAFGALATFKLGHGQTYTVMLAPVLGLLLLAGWRRQGPPAAACAAAAGLLYGLLALTAPQTAWFLGFDAALALLIAAVASLLPAFRPTLTRDAVRRLAALAAGGAVGLAVGLVPVAVIYGQTIAGRARNWDELHAFMPRLADIVNLPPGNAVWSRLLDLTGIADRTGRAYWEVALGFTPGMLAAAAAGVVLTARSQPGTRPDRPAKALLLGVLLVPILAWLLTIEVDGVSAWRTVYDFVPGASGIRTPFRIQLASLFFLCLGAAIALPPALEAARLAGRRWQRGLIAALVCLCVVEQANPGPSTRDTAPVRRWLAAAHRPGFPCDVFYILPQTVPPLPWPTRQADAMLLVQAIGMPTVNGLSSWYPPGWELLEPDSPGYGANVLAWAAAHGGGASFCGVDPRAGRWVAGLAPLQGVASD